MSTTNKWRCPPAPIDSVTYDKTYQAWKDGFITNEGVEQIFGGEWLFLFQLASRGIEQDTMAPIMLDEDNRAEPLREHPQSLKAPPPGQDRSGEAEKYGEDEPGMSSVALTMPDDVDTARGGEGQWTQHLRNAEGVVLNVGDSSLEVLQDGGESHFRDEDGVDGSPGTGLCELRGQGHECLGGNGEGISKGGEDEGADVPRPEE